MSLILIGTNYKYSEIETREKFFLSKKGIQEALFLLLEQNIAAGAVILSTCQRIELYAQTDDLMVLKNYFLGAIQDGRRLVNNIYIKEDRDALLHLFMVAAGLDSQVIGENEILHQVKEAYLRSKNTEVTTVLLNKVFERALFVGKFIREKTQISRRNPSVALAAVELAEQLSGNFNGKNIFIIGAGSVAQRLVRLCAERGAGCIVVANRTFEKARELAQERGAQVIRFEQFYDLLNEIDILFSATASKHLILKKELFIQKRNSKKGLKIFDLAFPRDIDPAIAGMKNVELFDLDDFKAESLLRSKEIELARNLVRQKSEIFFEKEVELWQSESVSVQAHLP